uniref:Dolichol-phosphate mannosyltransferase subunit 3 n=1 Tax=Panagrolaimus superbus TaxID=310955 RepID=A0A914YMV4_9BILA
MATECWKKAKLLGIIAISLYGLAFILGFNISSYLWLLFGFLVAFGVYSFVTVMTMACSFNDCVEAKNELSEEVKEALAYFEGVGFSRSIAENSNSSTHSSSSH